MVKLSVSFLTYSGLAVLGMASAFTTSPKVYNGAFQRTTIGGHQLELQMATVPPSESASVGIVGRGYISVAIAKIASVQGYNTW